jgi:sugar/nucleoside kinase (ribokinase family)
MAHDGARSVVVCGHLCLDIIPSFPLAGAGQDWFRPGRLSVVGAPVLGTGGPVSNVGLALHRLGLPVRLVARIGDDPLGKIVLDRVSSMSPELASGIHPVSGEVTSYSVVLNPPGVDRIFFHCPGANDAFTGDELADSVLEGAAIFHFGYPPLMEKIWQDGGARLEKLFARARDHGALTSLDMSLPDPKSPSGKIDWKAFLARVLPRVDIFVPSVEELLYMVDRPAFERFTAQGGSEAIIREMQFEDLARLADDALRLGVSAVLIKLGDRGAYLRTGSGGLLGMKGWAGRELYTPVFSVPMVAGTTGAGDSTISGFLASIFKCLGAEEALTMAVAVGGCCVEAPDALSGIRPWDETLRRLDEGWRRVPATVREKGWKEGPKGVHRGPHDIA